MLHSFGLLVRQFSTASNNVVFNKPIKAANCRSQTSVDKGDKGVDFSLRLKKSDHVITFCGSGVSKENNLKKSFYKLLISSDKLFRPVLLAVNTVSGFSLWGEKQKIASRDRYSRNRRVTKKMLSHDQSFLTADWEAVWPRG